MNHSEGADVLKSDGIIMAEDTPTSMAVDRDILEAAVEKAPTDVEDRAIERALVLYLALDNPEEVLSRSDFADVLDPTPIPEYRLVD